MANQITFGEVIAGTVELLRRNPLPVVAYIAGMVAFEAAILLIEPDVDRFWPILLVTIVVSYFIIERLMVAEGFVEAGRPLRHMATYLGIVLLSGMASLIGLAFLILPGLYMLARWSAAIPLAISSNLSVTAAMSRSWELTRSSTWPLIGFYALLTLGQVLLGVFSGESGPFSALGLIESIITSISDLIGIYVLVAIFRKLDIADSSLEEIFS